MAGSSFGDTIEGRLERLEQLLATVVVQQVAILDKLDEPTVGWMDTTAASLYLSLSPRAVRAAEAKGHLKGHRTAHGRVLYARSDLDHFAVANDGGR